MLHNLVFGFHVRVQSSKSEHTHSGVVVSVELGRQAVDAYLVLNPEANAAGALFLTCIKVARASFTAPRRTRFAPVPELVRHGGNTLLPLCVTYVVRSCAAFKKRILTI